MDGSINHLSQYRLGRAEEMMEAAKTNYEIRQYKTSLNRSYYVVFTQLGRLIYWTALIRQNIQA
jgi:uncharacterized protein (UPF0332 family)